MDRTRQLLLELESASEEEEDEQEFLTTSSPSRLTSSPSRPSRALAAAAARGSAPDSSGSSAVPPKATRRVDIRLAFLKAQQGGRLPVFDDNKPDPGCGHEVLFYQRIVDPVHRAVDGKLKVRLLRRTTHSDAHSRAQVPQQQNLGKAAVPPACCRQLP